MVAEEDVGRPVGDAIETREVIQTRFVSGCSRLKSFWLAEEGLAHPPLTK
jgi:hypothetical protein